ncbi:MAG: DUF2723 domain-containing protein [Anaerolineae bacterium]
MTWNRKYSNRVSAFILTLTAFFLYLRTLAPGVLDGDSGEWQYMSNILGVAHSTGYPLYLLIGKVFTLLPIGNPAWRVNLVSATSAALAVGVIYLLAYRVSQSRIAAAVAAALMAVAPTLWASAVEAEVYALNTLLLSLTFYFAVRWYQDQQPRDLYLMALSFGLALDNHRVSAFAAFGFLVLIWFMRRYLNRRRFILAALLVLIPLLLYAYIPIRASQLLADQSPADWELYHRADAYLKGTVSAYYNHSVSGFFNLVTGFDNRNKLGFADSSSGDSILARIGNSGSLLLQQFNPIILAFAAAGIMFLWKRDRRLAVILFTIAAGITAISVTLRAQSTRYYFSGAYLILALFFAVGAAALLQYLQPRPRLRVAAVGLLALLPLAALALNYRDIDNSGNTAYDTYARTVLADQIAPNAVVIAPWEIATGLRYLQFVEGQRADLLVVHESPIRDQYQKLLTAAHDLKRPFYYVQFTPEDQNAPGPRTVQAVGLPLLDRPQPRYAMNAQLIDSVRVLGYDLSPDPAQPGQLLRLGIYYQVTGPINAQYKAGLDWNDILGEPHGNWEQMPVSVYNPTYFWKTGDYYRDVWDIPLTADMLAGLYTPQLNWYTFDPTTNTTDYDHPHSISLSPLRIGNFEATAIAHSQRAEFTNGMALMGYNLKSNAPTAAGPARLARGQKLDLSLYWSTTQPLKQRYTMFVHLEDAGGVVRAQSDHAPYNGLFPTDRWPPGETVQDDYTLDIPNDLPDGAYKLKVGLYTTPDQRIPLAAGGDQVTLDTPIK